MTLHIAVPIRPGDVELYGEDPYRSAQNWHDAWQRTLPVIEAARGYVEARARLSRPEGEYNETDDRWLALLASLAELDSKGG